ncbi:MAG: antitoxin [Deltaproteobacteria bacterium]|nr:antitoxin [Deltaproteobacteria bacterium]
MRTTLDIDEDILMAAKELARRAGTTAGAVLSDLARSALLAPKSAPIGSDILGFEPFASQGRVVTTELVQHLQDEEG